MRLGSGVDDLHPGDAVCLCAVITLFYLSRVSEGFYSQCAKYDFGSQCDGGFAEYIVVKRKKYAALPTDMPIEDGAFIEPITVGLRSFSFERKVEENEKRYYYCAGTIGLLAIQCAVALGAKSVTAIDISSENWHWQNLSVRCKHLTVAK